MRARPVRSRIYLPVVRFGVVSSDWKFVLAATLAGYLIPFFLKARIMNVPLFMWTGLAGAALSWAFFSYARIGRRGRWLQHTLRARTQSPIRRRSLPSDQKCRGWLVDN